MSNLIAATRLLLLPLLISVGAGLVVRTAVVQTFSIPSASMAPTLEPGDHILVTPYGGVFPSEPRRGEVIVFRNPLQDTEFFVKRIIASPGDVVEVAHGEVRVNGQPLAEPYALPAIDDGALLRHLDTGEYFVMGDNRPNSVDSRTWGPLRRERIVGRARAIFWSAATDGAHGTANAMALTGEPLSPRPIRWTRILSSVR